jgi:hypothetical protein
VFRGTPPIKPLNCKIRFSIRRAAINRSRAHHTGDQPTLVVAKINLSRSDITWMSFYVYSRSLVPFVNCRSTLSFRREIKNPAYFRKQGWRKSLSSFRTCLHRVYPNNFRASALQLPRIVQGQTHSLDYGYDVSLSRRASSAIP